MTIGSVDLAEIQQTLNEMQNAAPPPPVDTASETFAMTLAQAAGGVGSLGDGMGMGDGTPFLEGLDEGGGSLAAVDGLPSASGSDGELNLVAFLLSAQEGGGTDGVSDTTGSGGVSGEDVVSRASQFEGVPYAWGGTTPQGFDCSGLVQYVYGGLGVDLPRTSEQQASVGTPVDTLTDAQPGDLVFFAGSDGSTTSPGHVGIYIGNGQMIDAPRTGTTVQVQSVSTAGPVVAIRRVLPTATSSGGTVMGNVTVPAAYASTIEQAAAANGVPASLLAALLSHESGFDPTAVSSAGAEGIAQFMPGTAAGMHIDPYDPTQAINGAATLLGTYATQFGSYADALAAYDAGPSAVARYGGIPPYAETEAYVPAVLAKAGLTAASEAVS